MSGVRVSYSPFANSEYIFLTIMKTYTVEEFQKRWDEMIDRVEGGEHIAITNGENTAVMIPADDHMIAIHSVFNHDAP